MGALGVLPDFSKRPGDLREAHEVVLERKKRLRWSICLETSKAIAVQRIDRMKRQPEISEEETFDSP